ncbi:hypothetical protein D3C85_1478990 [compost metagenome]
MPFHTLMLNSGTPASAKVGTSGIWGSRLALATARAVTRLPSWMGIIVTVWSITASTVPAIRSAMAGPAPRYGICMPCVSVTCMK